MVRGAVERGAREITGRNLNAGLTRRMLITKSAPQPRSRSTASGGMKMARLQTST